MNSISNLPLSGLIILTLVSSIFLSSTIVSTEDVHVSNVNVAVPVSCEISGEGNTSHSAVVNNGTYREDIGKTTLTVFCNDASGFAIYAAGYTGDVIGETDSTKLIGIASDLKISTGTYVQGTTTDSVWSMKLTKVTDTSEAYNPNNLTIENGFSSYSAVPNAYTKVASFSSTTDLTLGSKLETTYAAYVSGLQRTDTYVGKVKYTIVHPASAEAPVACNTNAATIGKALCMQDFTGPNRSAIIASMVQDQQYTIKDKRDGKTYTIAKLADGNVWMNQNLDLDLDSTRVYTNEDTDIGYNATTGEYDTATWIPSKATYATNDNTWEWSTTTLESYDPGNVYWSGVYDWTAYYNSCDNNSENCDESLNPETSAFVSSGIPQYKLGNFYNWTAAVAMNDSSEYLTDGIDVNQSICPAGWTLPKNGTGDGTFYDLWGEYGLSSSADNGTNSLWGSPLYYPVAGAWRGSFFSVGKDSYYWTSVVAGDRYAYGSDINGRYNHAYPNGGGGRISGSSIRCIVR